jgi:hypothetical protein
MWRIAAWTVSDSSTGNSSSPSHVRPLTPNRSDTGGRPFNRRISTAWISFLRATASAPTAHGARAGGASPGSARRASTPHRARPPGGSPCHQGSRRLPGARPARGSPRPPTLRPSPPTPPDPHARGFGRTPQVRPATSRSATPTRSTPSSTIAISQKSRCTSNPIALPTDPFTTTSSRRWTGEPAGERQRPIRARSTTGQAAGAAKKTSPRSKRIVQTGLPDCVLPQSPCPGHPTVRSQPDSKPRSMIFMPRRVSGLAALRRSAARRSLRERARPRTSDDRLDEALRDVQPSLGPTRTQATTTRESWSAQFETPRESQDLSEFRPAPRYTHAVYWAPGPAQPSSSAA